MIQESATLFDSHNHLIKCRSCYSDKLSNIINFKRVPLAGSFYREPFSGVKFSLGLVRCNICGLIQTANSCPRDLIYKQYSYNSGLNAELMNHFDELVYSVSLYAPPPRRIIEIGSNDGSLILKLQERGYECLGVDPSDVALQSSTKSGWPLYNDYLTRETAASIHHEHGSFDIVISCNSIAHNDEILDIFEGLHSLASPGALILIELQDGRETIRKGQFDTIYHEHTCYFTPHSISNLLNRTGFHLLRIDERPIHNGSIRILAGKSHYISSESPPSTSYAPSSLSELTDINSFKARVKQNYLEISSMLKDLIDSRQTIIGFGASGRASMMISHYNLDSLIIKCVVDNSPLKQGRFFACTNIEVRAKSAISELAPDVIFVFAWNYLDEIIAECRDLHGFNGRFLVPLPSPVVI